MARGNRREPIFRDDEDREMMLRTLGQSCQKCGWQVHAWVLMGNHFHFIIHTPKGHLVDGMKWFMNTYTRRLNTRHGLWGRVFGDRYKSVLIEPPEHAGETDHLRTVIGYVHLNPIRAGLLERGADGWEWRNFKWSSLIQVYMEPAPKRAAWAHAGFGLGLEGLDDTKSGRMRYLKRMEQIADDWLSQRELAASKSMPGANRGRKSDFISGWYRGGESFKEWLLEKAGEALPTIRNRNYASSEQFSDHSLKRAEEFIAKGCAIFGLDPGSLRTLPGSDPRKVAVASLIWRETSVGQRWIAGQLGMSSAANVSQQIRRHEAALPERFGESAWQRWLDAVNNC